MQLQSCIGKLRTGWNFSNMSHGSAQAKPKQQGCPSHDTGVTLINWSRWEQCKQMEIRPWDWGVLFCFLHFSVCPHEVPCMQSPVLPPCFLSWEMGHSRLYLPRSCCKLPDFLFLLSPLMHCLVDLNSQGLFSLWNYLFIFLDSSLLNASKVYNFSTLFPFWSTVVENVSFKFSLLQEKLEIVNYLGYFFKLK